jgi:adenylate kinase
MIIIVSGSVGTGKTALSRKLAEKLNYQYIDIKKIIAKYKLKESYDKKRKTYVVDIKKLNPILIKIIEKSKNLIIDSHLSHYLPKRYVDLCIITKCDLKTLEKRLKKKGYNKSKIRENLDCEIFDVCLNEAKEAGHKILVVDTTKGTNINKIIKKIK